jgi:hypothetical protein
MQMSCIGSKTPQQIHPMNPVALGLGLSAPDDPIVEEPSGLFQREEQALQQQSLQQKLEQTLQQQEQQQHQLPQQHFMPFMDSGQGGIMTSVSSGAASSGLPPVIDQHHQVSGTVSLRGGMTNALPLQLEAQAVNSYLAMMSGQQNTGGPFSAEVPDMQRQLVPSPQQSMDLLAQPRFFQQDDAGNLQIQQQQQQQQLDQQQKDDSRSGPKDMGRKRFLW